MDNLTPAIKQEIGILSLENKQALIEYTQSVVAKYQNLVITDDDEQVKEIKKQRAELNKIGTYIDNKRKEIKKEFEKPLKEFEKDMKEVKSVVDETLKDVDRKLDEVEQQRIIVKRDVVKKIIDELSEGYEIQFKDSWLNKTTKETHIADDIKMLVYEAKQEEQRFEKAKETIESACQSYGLTSEGYIEMAKRGIDVMEVIALVTEAGKRKIEENKETDEAKQEVKQVESEKEVTEVTEEVVTRFISVTGTKEQLRALNDFCIKNGIVISA